MAYYDNDRRYGRNDDRNWFDRATDEVASWFQGDDNENNRQRDRYGDTDRRRWSDSERNNSDRNWYRSDNYDNGHFHRSPGMNYDFDNDYDTGRTYSSYGGDEGRYASRDGNFRGYGSERGYSQRAYSQGNRSSEYDNDRGYDGRGYQESYRGNRGMGGYAGMSGQGNYSSSNGYNDRSSRASSDYDNRYDRPMGNYSNRSRYDNYDGGGSSMNYTGSEYGGQSGSRSSWAGSEDHSYENGRGYDMYEGRSGRNDWSNGRGDSDGNRGASRNGRSASDQGFGRQQDYRYNDRTDRDYTGGYGNRYGSHYGSSQNGGNYNSTNYGRR